MDRLQLTLHSVLSQAFSSASAMDRTHRYDASLPGKPLSSLHLNAWAPCQPRSVPVPPPASGKATRWRHGFKLILLGLGYEILLSGLCNAKILYLFPARQ
ncbi:hypothetical protein BDN71DRAFT_1443611 [Pleurotus eryngii]|uniref:Uncharacterized protein n=1 Tax=Pleurotus eryngii TaxID=5323 RepID=A0A9P6A1P7_PLEER|nr:hypothetical protein BDN71DRAFT_1443611 [Pleurotus eryngii]